MFGEFCDLYFVGFVLIFSLFCLCSKTLCLVAKKVAGKGKGGKFEVCICGRWVVCKMGD